MLSCIFRAELSSASAEVYPQALLAPRGARNVHVHISVTRGGYDEARKRRYLGRYFAHPMMQNRRAKRDDYKPSAVRVTQRYVP
ncbi:hypothetical protein X973_12570 [Piscirickettsia salmonis]|nr:hypothetical protein X973_12570 [Piscirickettsia salmonis]